MRSSLLLLVGSLVAAQADAQLRREFTELHLGVAVRIVLYAPDTSARPAARAAFARIAALEDKMSDYRPASEARRLAATAGAWAPVSPELFAVLRRAVTIARATNGAFDPTVGPYTALWRETRRTGRLPSRRTLDSAAALVGWERLELDTIGQRVRLTAPGMRLDLGGIAKGYILDEALRVLRGAGVASALIVAGGDVVAGDPPPGAAGWRVAAPFADSGVAAGARALARGALSTSGATEQSVEIDGVRYAHIVDPRTGLGLTTAHVASVLAPDGATADALATALAVLGPEAGPTVVARFPGVVVAVTGSGPRPSPRR